MNIGKYVEKGFNAVKSNLSINGFKGLNHQVLYNELGTAREMLAGLDKHIAGGLTEEMAKKYAKTLGASGTDINSIRSAAQARISNLEQANRVVADTAGSHNLTTGKALGYNTDKITGKALYGGRMAYEYMWGSATGAQRATRIGAAAGGYMAGSALVRGASSYGTNSRGESDIAGIPFI